MKSIVFDTSTIISIATNNLLHILEDMKKRFGGEFYIVDAVKREAIDVPIKGKLYKLEAIMVADLVNRGIIKVYSSKELVDKANKIAELANNIYKAKGNHLKLVHSGEVESLAIACDVNGTLAIDERTTRLLIENADLLAKILRKKLHTNIFVDRKKLAEFKDMVCNVNVIRSADILVVAYELGLFDGYLSKSIFATSRRELLDALLWGVKLRGCSISGEEIDRIIELEGLKDKV
jgi:predicted nucleic acid-binding protein